MTSLLYFLLGIGLGIFMTVVSIKEGQIVEDEQDDYKATERNTL